jgi:lipid-binding SYLF domain-containing protein
MTEIKRRVLVMSLATATLATMAGFPVLAADPNARGKLNLEADKALEMLLDQNAAARDLSEVAHGMLIFPSITKGGFIVGMAGGRGVLRVGGDSIAYFETGGLSVGFKAGIQSYGYVLMFLTESALQKFRESTGFKLGVDASFAVIKGDSVNVDTVRTKSEIVAFIFNTQGLMLDASIEGSQYQEVDL